MEEAGLEDAEAKRVRQRAKKPPRKDLRLGTVGIDLPADHLFVGAAQGHALQQIHDEHALRDQRLDGLRRDQGCLSRLATRRGHQRFPNPPHGLRLRNEIELFLKLLLELAEHNVVIDRDLVKIAQLLGQGLQVGNIGHELGFYGGPLNLHRDLFAPKLLREGRAVHLRDRRSSEGIVIKLGEHLFELEAHRLQEFLLDDRFGEARRHGVQEVGETG
mmetsp:Transcript_12505/g.46263  ORF Transcript_12505/g.46263 Transcript_12505/m.46263 type:complete len:217 (+) Transcript_12505:438-1088(+)